MFCFSASRPFKARKRSCCTAFLPALCALRLIPGWMPVPLCGCRSLYKRFNGCTAGSLPAGGKRGYGASDAPCGIKRLAEALRPLPEKS